MDNSAQQNPQGLQVPMFYKPDPNSHQVYDTQGNAITLAQYKQMTGQNEIPDNQINWGFIQNTAVPPKVDTASIWSLPGMDSLRTTLTPADQAFAEALYKTTQSQIAAGGVGSVDAGSMQKALQIAATDPAIKSTYGDAAALNQQQLGFNLQQINNNWNTGQAAQQATLYQQKQALDQQIASAGQAYSGFAQKARQNLAASQNDIIQSTRSQLQQQIQSLGSQQERLYGSGFPGMGGSSAITAGGYTYQPTGGIIGTQNQAQTQAETSLAQGYGILPSVSSTGTLTTTGGK